jgi:GNAT superfamily N-acetyltransferase
LDGSLRIRRAEPADTELIFSLIVELAEYERAPDRVVGTPALLSEALFGDDPVAEAVIAEVDGEPAGLALWFRTFSTWLCLPGLWLEDLYVRPEHRREGVGRTLLAHVARVAADNGYGRVEWSALDWNTPALEFYAGLGAERLVDWEVHRLEGEALARLAASAGDGPLPLPHHRPGRGSPGPRPGGRGPVRAV